MLGISMLVWGSVGFVALSAKSTNAADVELSSNFPPLLLATLQMTYPSLYRQVIRKYVSCDYLTNNQAIGIVKDLVLLFS
jgi:hypothetical protein